jgi:hypothetical protein
MLFGQNPGEPEINVIYGDNHIFTIETPENWINDRDLAQKLGLVCFFYPILEINKSPKNYCFANGLDKTSQEETLADFIEGDLKELRKKYPDFDHEKIPVAFDGGVKNGVLLSFSNLTDKFKEEVVYAETEESFIIFSFSALTEDDYIKYQPTFDAFVASFQYQGNNPKPFLEYMKGQK